MPVFKADQLQDRYVVVGFGAGGAQAACTLPIEGVKPLVLESGRSFDPDTEVAMFQLPSQASLRGEGTPENSYGFHDCSIQSGWDIPGEPYASVHLQPERQFQWWCQSMTGGRTNHWGRISLICTRRKNRPKPCSSRLIFS